MHLIFKISYILNMTSLKRVLRYFFMIFRNVTLNRTVHTQLPEKMEMTQMEMAHAKWKLAMTNLRIRGISDFCIQ